MWKPIGVLSVLGLMLISLLALAICAWYYDKWDLNTLYNNTSYAHPYVNGCRAVLAADLLAFIASIFGLFVIVKPSGSSAKCFCVLIVLVVVFKLIAGAVFYAGVDDNGKNYNKQMDTSYDLCNKYDVCSDGMKAYHAERGMEIASIILITLLGLFSAVAGLKLSG